MKISCQSCQAKYTIADEKVAGKTVKIKLARSDDSQLREYAGVAIDCSRHADAGERAQPQPHSRGWSQVGRAAACTSASDMHDAADDARRARACWE